MAGRPLLGRIKASRGLMAVLGLAWAIAAVGSAMLWSDMTWRSDSASNPQALEQQASAQLDGANPSAARLAAAEELTRTELTFGPYRPAAWSRLAYIQYKRAGRLDAASIQSLERSYQMARFDSDAFLWRTQFVFENWDQAPPGLRQAALRETRAFYSLWENRKQIDAMAARIHNPSGRLALQLVLLQAPLPGAPPS
jgi:hypothetical protein